MLSRLMQISVLMLVPAWLLPLSETLECEEISSGMYSHGSECYTTGGYDTGTDACRAAEQGLKDVLVIPTGVTCDNTGCEPESRHTGVLCKDSDCSGYLMVGPPIINTKTGKYKCTACWLGGAFNVFCSSCQPL
jgi:hypothetical protein